MSAHWPAGGLGSASLPLNVLLLLFDRIARHIPISDVLCLSQTHPLLRVKLPAHLSQSFDELLASRISRVNVDGFRTLLLRTRAAISGSTVLHFILRDGHWKPGDFDLYAPFGTGYTIVHWLVKQEGYKIVSDGSRSFIFHPHTLAAPSSPCDWTTHLVATSSLHRKTETKRYNTTNSDIYRVYKLCSTNDTFVDVIESSKPAFIPPIIRFHSTIVMNYLTPTSLVVLYPRMTFRREGILQYRDENTLESYDDPNGRTVGNSTTTTTAPEVNRDYIRKYRLRGFTLFSRPADLQRPCGAACPSLRRTVSDVADEWALCIPIANVQTNPATRRTDTESDGAEPAAGPVPPASASSAPRSQPPTTFSWSSSFSDDINVSEMFSSTSANSRNMSSSPPNPGVPALDQTGCSRPPLPRSQWTLLLPPLLSQGRQSRNRRRDMCRNPFCLHQGFAPGSLILDGHPDRNRY